MDDVDAAPGLGQLLDELAGSVRRVVVDDQNTQLDARAERLDLSYERLDVLALVISRNDDQRFHWSFPRMAAADAAPRTTTAAPSVNTDINSPRLRVDES